MRDKTEITQRQVHVNANSGAARQLSSLLPGCGLDKLDDDEASTLIAFMNYLDANAAEEGFREGWNCGRNYEQQDYNGDVQRLLEAGPSTEH